MDNKQDRNFYWEVKDFMGKPQEIHKPVKTPNDMVSSIKNILEQNKLYKPSSFNHNINSASTIRQAINAIERNNQKGTPENIQHTKNITSNPFGVIREGIFDETLDAVSKKIKTIAGNIGMSTDATAGEVGAQVDSQQLTPGVPLTPDQKAMRDLEGQVKAKEDMTAANLNTNTQQATTAEEPEEPAPEDRSADDRENNRGKAPMAPVSPPPPPPPPEPEQTQAPQSSPQPSVYKESSKLKDTINNLRGARGMMKGDGDGGGAAGAAARTSDRRARSDAIRTATIAAGSERDELKSRWNEARAKDPGSSETIALQKELRAANDSINPAGPQQGNIRQSDIALRYAKPGQRGGSQQSEAETTRIANEFIASQKALKAPAEDRSADDRENNRGKAPMVSTTPADDVKDGDFSRRDGSRGNTNTPTPAPADDVKDGDFSRRDGSRGNINTPAPADDVKTGDFSRRDGSRGNMGTGMPSKTPTPSTTTPLSTTTNSGSGLGSGFLNSPTEETAPNIFPNMTLSGKEVNKKTKDLSTSLQA
jgi:hypothetical protein